MQINFDSPLTHKIVFLQVLLEVLTGRKALETSSHSKNVYLVRSFYINNSYTSDITQSAKEIFVLFCFFLQKDLVSELEDDGRSYSRRKDTTRELSNSQAAENIWKKHLDPWLMSKGTSGPDGSKEVAQLACRCLDRRRKKRPPMTEVGHNVLFSPALPVVFFTQNECEKNEYKMIRFMKLGH